MQHIQEALKKSPVLKVRVEMTEEFTPARVPMNYDSKSHTGMVGLENLGATCYLNALLQMLYHVNSFRKAVYKLPHSGEVFTASTTLALQSVFRNLQFSKKEVTTKDLTVAFGWTTAESFMQQDVQEMMRVLIDKLEEKMANTVVDGFIKNLMAGSVRSFIKCVNVDYESKREEAFYDIQLDVKGCKDIYESFKRYTTSELLEGENQYAADGHGKQDAKKGVIFTKFPPVLTIHLKRFDFDMQTMGFNKIHDYYEFPQRLELDEFLAEDCPEESKAIKNTYLLHSVLVHAGDVGGGHYYAYIRPSCNYDYNTAHKKHQHKDKQWFKFNDENVIPVRAREAIEHCYGRKQIDNLLKGGMSSAYMLVYIRESEAPQIMEEVVDSDIPSDLTQRIEVEMKERNDRARAEMRNKLFTTVYYATEDDVRNFTAYSKFTDFFSTTGSNRRSVTVMNQSTKLNVLMRIAADMDVSPLSIRLWVVEKPQTGKSGYGARPAHDVSHDDLSQKINKANEQQEMYYVQVIDPPVRESGLQKWREVKAAEDAWLKDASYIISRDPMFSCSTADDDAADGCGMGSSNQILKHAMKNDPPGLETMKGNIDAISQAALGLIKKYCPDIGNDLVLLFVKAFDPVNSLHPTPSVLSKQLQAAAESPTDRDSLKSQEDLFQDAAFMDYDSNAAVDTGAQQPKPTPGDDHSLGSLVTQKLSLASGAVGAKKAKGRAAEEYMPLKYLGSLMISRHTKLRELEAIVQNMLQQYSGESILPIWLNPANYQLSYFAGPSRWCPLSRVKHGDEVGILNAVFENQASYVLTVELPILLDEGTAADHHLSSFGPSLLPNKHIKMPFDFLQYRANRRECCIKPISLRDSQIVINTWEAEHGSLKSSNLEGSLSTGESVSTADEGSTGPCTTYSCYFAITMSFSEILDTISAKIGIPAEHIILYVYQSFAYRCEVDLEAANEMHPQHKGSKDMTLADYIANNKFMDKPNSSYSFVYQISPFSLVDEKNIAMSHNFKSFEFVIADARLRRWRHFYLRHHEQAAHQAGGGSGGHATTSEESEEQETGGASYDMKRRRISPLPTDYHHQEAVYAEPDPAMLSKAEWPKDHSEKYDIQEDNKVRVRVSKQKTLFQQLTYYVRGVIGVPTNIDKLVTPATGLTPRDQEAWDQVITSPLFTDNVLTGFTAQYGAVTSDLVKRAPTGEFVPAYPLALTGIRANVVNEVCFGTSDLQDVITSWMDATITRNSLFQTGVQHVTLLDMVFMQSRHPKIRSVIVSVYSFTLLGNVVQPCDLDQFGGPFVTYLREDDDYESFAARVRTLSGDSEEEWEKCRLAVVKRRVPHFIKRPALSHVSHRLGNTKLSSTDSLEGMGGVTHGDEHSHAATGAVVAAGETVSLWESFAAKYDEYCKGDKLADVVRMNRQQHKDSAQWSYPQLGIQRPVADVYTKTKRYVPKAIKIT